MPQTIFDLGKKVKAKYPGQYDDLSDDEVGRRVKAKFPGAYDDFADAPTGREAFKQPEGSAARRFLKGAWDTTVGGLGDAAKLVMDAGRAVATGTPVSADTAQALGGIVQAQGDQGRKAKEAVRQGRYSEAVGHGLAAALPVVGPAAARAAEKMGGEAPKLDRFGNVVEEGQAPDIAGGLGEAAGLVASVSPKNIATPVARGVAKAAGKAIPHRLTPEGLYQSSLRPGLSKRNIPKIEKEVQTGLREGVTVDRKGLQKADATIDALNQEIADRLRGKSDELGPVVSPRAVAGRVEEVRPKFADQVNPDADLLALDRSKQQFLEKHTTNAPYTKIRPGTEEAAGTMVPEGTGVTSVEQPLTLAEAQAEKQGTYRQLKDKAYGELKSADIEAQKALARGLKEEIAKRVPELDSLNAREGALIELQTELERMVAREGNKNVLGLVPATMAHNPYGFLATLLMDNPAIKSRIAIALNRARRIRPSSSTVGAASPVGLAAAAENEDDLPRYARGGVIARPTVLVDAESGEPSGVMAEEGPEAIVPLTAERETVPEKPETLHAQLEQLEAGVRNVVMFPRGTPLLKRPRGMKSYQDERGNVFVFNPNKTSQPDIDAAIQNNSLPDLLGPAAGGMGAPDKSELAEDAIAVVGRDRKGTTVQATATDEKNLPKTVRQTAKVTPKRGKVSVESPTKEIERRLDIPSPDSAMIGPRSPQWYERHRKRQWFHKA